MTAYELSIVLCYASQRPYYPLRVMLPWTTNPWESSSLRFFSIFEKLPVQWIYYRCHAASAQALVPSRAIFFSNQGHVSVTKTGKQCYLVGRYTFTAEEPTVISGISLAQQYWLIDWVIRTIYILLHEKDGQKYAGTSRRAPAFITLTSIITSTNRTCWPTSTVGWKEHRNKTIPLSYELQSSIKWRAIKMNRYVKMWLVHVHLPQPPFWFLLVHFWGQPFHRRLCPPPLHCYFLWCSWLFWFGTN